MKVTKIKKEDLFNSFALNLISVSFCVAYKPAWTVISASNKQYGYHLFTVAPISIKFLHER